LAEEDPITAGARTRIGYCMRPILNLVPGNKTATPAEIYLPLTHWAKTTYNLADTATVQWPKINDLVHNAILSDITPHYPGLKGRHRDGVNALFGSGDATWIPKKQFIDNLLGPGRPSTSETDPNVSFSTGFNDFMLNESTNPVSGYWGDLDRYR